MPGSTHSASSSDDFAIGADAQWPLTERTRYVMWFVLSVICDELASDLAQAAAGQVAMSDAEEWATVVDRFPRVTWSQPPQWWGRTLAALERVQDAMRTGEDVTPRSPAEEAGVYVATLIADDYREGGDLHEVVRDELAELPASSADAPDYEFEEVLPSITGDADIEMIFLSGGPTDGVEDPESEENQFLGMGDYRLGAWHEPFPRFIGRGGNEQT